MHDPHRSRGVFELSLDNGGSGDVLSLMPGLREALVWHLQSLAQQHRWGAVRLIEG
jgi:hypothetical protein